MKLTLFLTEKDIDQLKTKGFILDDKTFEIKIVYGKTLADCARQGRTFEEG
jgi:hypothetical protein